MQAALEYQAEEQEEKLLCHNMADEGTQKNCPAAGTVFCVYCAEKPPSITSSAPVI